MEGGVAGCVIGSADFSWPGACSWPFPAPGRYGAKAARQKMLVCMPLVGLLAGGVWAGAWLLMRGAPGPVRAAVCAAAPWLVTGFMHLDGYMDVCDAVLSRRDLATRQRILKDSHCGAFAVICMVLLAMGQWSLFLAAEDVSWLGLLLIPAATRACAGLAVLGLRPMGTSQYAAMGPARGGYGAALWVLLALSVGLPLWLGGSFGPLAAAAGTAWRCGTAIGIWTACPGISPALP
ncbi:MAG: adenosylcobinamide-GDP ribazoletransferase [Oscillospiraceae bacterium]